MLTRHNSPESVWVFLYHAVLDGPAADAAGPH